jgi:hypothetical protein
MSHAKIKSGSLNSNLTFFGLNMVILNDLVHLFENRGCGFTLARLITKWVRDGRSTLIIPLPFQQ